MKNSKQNNTAIEEVIVDEVIETDAIIADEVDVEVPVDPSVVSVSFVESGIITATDVALTIVVNGKEMKLEKGITYNGDGTFTDAHGRNVSNIGWHAGRYIGVGLNHLVNAYKLDPKLATRLTEIINELIPVRDSYHVTTKSAKSKDPEVLKAQYDAMVEKQLKQQNALMEAIKLAELAKKQVALVTHGEHSSSLYKGNIKEIS